MSSGTHSLLVIGQLDVVRLHVCNDKSSLPISLHGMRCGYEKVQFHLPTVGQMKCDDEALYLIRNNVQLFTICWDGTRMKRCPALIEA